MLRGKYYHHVSLFETKDEYQHIIKLLDREPIDAISVSTHGCSDTAFGTQQNMAQITRAVTKLPLMICGKIYDRASADEALEDADIVLSAKSILLDRNWVEDIKAGKELRLQASAEANVALTDEPLL
jgi:2,4-dienoyl-CoA reductase-like NADH-dependent reductase (Old Yellow Enzyme family)